MIERIKESPRTTWTGIAAAMASIVGLFGLNIDAEIIATILTAIVAVLGLFAKDK